MEETKVLGDFDPHVVHHRDEVSKRVVKVNPYRLLIHKGARYFEWPKGSGNLWYENRVAAGRLNDNGEPVLGAEHVVYDPPMTEDEKLAIRSMALEQENKKLQAELTAIKKEMSADAAIAKEAASQASVQRVKPSESKPAEVKASAKK